MYERINACKKGGTALLGIGVLLAALVAGGCSDGGHHHNNPKKTVTLQGVVMQGPVSGARIFADRAPYNNTWDAAEEFTFTAADGSYSFPALGGDFRLCTEGGIDTLTNQPATQLMAPSDADNVTPLTTLVALAPTPGAATQIKLAIASLAGVGGDAYDADPSAGISAPLLTLMKSVEATLQVFASNFGVTSPADQQALLTEIGSQLVAARKDDPTGDPAAVLQTALATAAEQKVTELAGDSYQLSDPVAAAAEMQQQISTLVGNIATAVEAAADPTGQVTETTALQDAVASQTDTTVGSIADNVVVETAAIALAAYQVQDAAGGDLDSDADPAIITVPAAQAAKVFVGVTGSSTFAADKTFTGVSVRLQIIDRNSKRQATFTLSGLSVTVAPGGALTFDDSAAVLTAAAVDAAGNLITTQSVNGPFASIVFTGTSVTFDLPAIQQLLADQVAADFGTIGKVGSYDVAVSVSGAPATGKSVLLNAN